MVRKATANWMGSGKEGTGKVSTQSGVLNNNNYSYHTRFEDGVGTNPEELIAAAHAGCFSMKLSFCFRCSRVYSHKHRHHLCHYFRCRGNKNFGINSTCSCSRYYGRSVFNLCRRSKNQLPCIKITECRIAVRRSVGIIV
jgi:hypothetical protein